MNYGYPPYHNGYAYDQKPSTSGMSYQPMQPLNNTQMQLRHPNLSNLRQSYMNDWIAQNPACIGPYPYHNPSPAPSVQSHGSVSSVNSTMSRFSQLTINTNFTQYTALPYYMSQSGTENMYPKGRTSQWTPKNVDDLAVQIIETLKKIPLYDSQMKLVINNVQYLVLGCRPNEPILPNERRPLDSLEQERLVQLLDALFRSIQFNEEIRANLDPRNIPAWDQNANRVLKYLTQIYCRFQATNRLADFEAALDKVQNPKPLGVLAFLLIPNKPYTSNAVSLFRMLLVNQKDPKIRNRRNRRLMEIVRHAWIMENLARIVAPSQEYMNNLERQLAIDTIIQIMRISTENSPQRFFLDTNLVPEMIRRYFKSDGEEGVLHKIPAMLFKLANSKDNQVVEKFFYQFENSNGYEAVADVLSHGSPRVLVATLKFLKFLHPARIERIPKLDNLVLAVLKLIGSTEVEITQLALNFTFNAVANNALVKASVTRSNGVEILLSALRLEYHSAQDPKITLPMLREIALEIRKTGCEILYCLVKGPPEDGQTSNYVVNPEYQMAVTQATHSPLLPSLVCNWFKDHEDEYRILMVRFVTEILRHSTVEDRSVILSQKVFFGESEKKEETCVAQSIVAFFFTIYMYFDRVGSQHPKKKDVLIRKILPELGSCIYTLCRLDGAKQVILQYIGKSYPYQHTLLFLFCQTNEPGLHFFLLSMMYQLAMIDDYAMKQLPFVWATDRTSYMDVMHYFMGTNEPEAIRMATHLINVVNSSPVPTPP